MSQKFSKKLSSSYILSPTRDTDGGKRCSVELLVHIELTEISDTGEQRIDFCGWLMGTIHTSSQRPHGIHLCITQAGQGE
jgi:hypothetical protein